MAEARLLKEFLNQSKLKQFNLVHAKRLGEALNHVVQEPFDVVLLDLTLPDSQGLSSLEPLIHCAPNLPIVVLTNTNDDELALEAVRQGAQDYLVKRQVNVELLVRSLRYAIERKQMLESLRAMNEALEVRVQERTEELIKAQKLNQFKSEFVSMLSHDFRNPLTTILLSAGLLQGSEEKLTREQKLAYFQRIQSAIKDMAQLLDEVSFIGKSDSGNLKCNLVPMDLVGFCYELVETAQMSSRDKGLDIEFDCQGNFCGALGDENLLRHILANLLANAIKYSPDGGIVKFGIFRQGQQVSFRVQDWGIGIPEKDHPHLFQPFHRASNVEMVPGTGLGLAIVKRCVEAYHGEIAFESHEGVGTTFIVTLPFASA